MNDPSSGACVFCGTERPRSQERCPTCGRPWIDRRLAANAPLERGEHTAGRELADAVATSAVDTTTAVGVSEVSIGPGQDHPGDGDPVEAVTSATGGSPDEGTIRVDDSDAADVTEPNGDAAATAPATADKPVRWWIPLGIALGVLAVYAIIFSILLSRSGREEIAAPVTTSSRAVEPSTTTTTVATTTTTIATTTTTTTLPPLPAAATPIAIEDLGLGAFQIGPLEFGDRDADAVGLLVASLGQPDTYFPVGESHGLCPTDEGRALVWGPLTAIFRDDDGAEVLAGYTLDGEAPAAADHPAAAMRTLSGAGLADTKNALELAYAQSKIVFEPLAGRDGFIVLRSSDDRTLLWGTLDGAEQPGVTLIASPRPCDGGPFAGG